MLALRSAARSYRCVCTGCVVTSGRSINQIPRSFNRSVNHTFNQTANHSLGYSSSRLFGSYRNRSNKKKKKPNLSELPREFVGVVTNVYYESRHRGWAAMKVMREPTLDEQAVAHVDELTAEFEDSNYKPESKPKRSAMVSGVVPPSVRLAVGLAVKLTGRWMYDSEHENTKFEFDSFTEIESTELSRDGMIEQLSATLPHVGPGLATKLLDHFGADVYRMLDERDHNITKVPRFPKPKLNAIFDAWHALKKVQVNNVEEIMFLLEHHLSPGERAQLLQKYEKHELCCELLWNPYICMQVEGITFIKADGLAMRLGFDSHDERRIRAAIMFNLSFRARQNGCSFISEADLLMWSHASLQHTPSSNNQLEPTMDITEIDESIVVPLDPPEQSVSKQKVNETITQLVADNIIKRELIEGFHHSWDQSYQKTVEYRRLREGGEVNPKPHQSISQSSQKSIVACYHARTWALEEGLAQRFARMLSPEVQLQRAQRLKENYASVQALQRSITNYERNNHFRFTEEQREAVIQASTGAVTIITGYPGTGKTQILKALVSLWREYNTVTLLCSPTGRAASKMQEMTGRPAMTMHRALDWIPFTSDAKDENTPDVSRTSDSLTVSEFSGGSFKHNSLNPLKASAYVIDEMSMVDLPLMYSMMDAIPLDAQVVLVGDPDQLPAVGAGNVLHDLIHSGVVNVVRLTQTIRQAEESILNQNARAVHKGIQPTLLDVSKFNPSETSDDVQLKSDAMFVQASKDAADSMHHLFTRVLPSLGGQIDPLVDVQVLTPKRERGAYSAANLNRIVQSMLNPPSSSRAEIRWYDSVFRVGDRVMQKRNNADRGVYNGELGEVIAIGPAPVEVDKKKSNMPVVDDDSNQSDEPPRLAITVRFDPRLKVADQVYLVDGVDMQEIGLAWALTVHKSQGGEFRVCVFACATEHERMLTRPLLYTAITRAKEKLIVVGDRHVLKWGARNKLTARFTALRVRLRRAMGWHEGATITIPANEVKPVDQSISHSVDQSLDQSNDPSIDQWIDQSNDQPIQDYVDQSSSQSDESGPLFNEAVSDIEECSGVTFEPYIDEKQHMRG